MRLARILLPAPLLAIFCWTLLCGVANAQDPDFSDTPDILNGQQYLIRSDDILLAQNGLPDPRNPAPYNTDSYLYSMLTANGGITTVQAITTTATISQPLFYNTAVAAGRMFDLPHDVVAVLAMDQSAPPGAVPLNLTIRDPQTGISITQQIAVLDYSGAALSNMVMADFTGDGFDDLAINYSSAESPFISTIQIVQATNPISLTAGVKVGPGYTSDTNASSLASAPLGGQLRPRLLLTTETALVVLNVNPNTLVLSVQSGIQIPNATGNNSVVSGNFDNDPTDQEAVVFALTSGTVPTCTAILYDFPAPQLQPTVVDTAFIGREGQSIDAVDAGKVHLLSSDSDAIVVGAFDGDPVVHNSALFVYTVENGQLVQQAMLPQDNAVIDVKLGNFDHRTATGAIDPDLQLAVLTSNLTGESAPTYANLRSYNIGSNGSGYTLTYSSPLTLTFGHPVGMLATGDLQGRSLRLSAPTKITINNHSAPRTIVGMPPMHLDWVVPSCSDPNYPNNCTTPHVVNILAYPTFNWAQFNTEVKGSIQSASHTSTGGGVTIKGDADAKLGFSLPSIESVSVEVKDAIQHVYATTINTDTNQYATFTFDTSSRTGFADHIWFDSSRFNIWSYRILGETACPAGMPHCTPSQRLPLHVQFSGPDQLAPYDLDGNVVEWYQPQWEPGNLLSYPWNEAQLLRTLPRPVINNKSDVWAADSSGSNASVTWEGGVGQQFSSGTTQSFSNDTSVTVSGETDVFGADFSASVGVDAETSNSTETLGTNGNEFGSSTGFTVNKSAQGVVDYVYTARTYILSQRLISDTLLSVPISATVPMSGSLRLNYWANPFDPQFGGPWWPRTYDLPDVALNHPQRWTWSTTPTQGDIMTFNPLTTTLSAYDQEFYYMRGLFVTDASAPQGPQLTTSTVTQTLQLQARVYNYSHVDMDAPNLAQKAAQVKVRFYGQVFQSDEGEYPVGSSFLIGETSLASIPGLASATTPGNLPNWRMATVDFNPANFAQTKNGNVFLRFWVVTWMEDSAHHMVKEMAGHGLTADPANHAIKTLSDVAVEPYSNNAGTYKQVFYIQDPNAVPAGAVSLANVAFAGAEPLTLTLSANLTSPPKPIGLGVPLGKYLLSTTIRNGADAQQSVQLTFFDGDPAQGAKAFDWEFIPHVNAGAQYVNRVDYAPPVCGDRKVFVVARFGSQIETTSMNVPNVACTLSFPFVEKH